MKRILLALLLLYCSAILKSQIRDTAKPVTPLQFDPDLLFYKATKQKNIVWILPGPGVGMTIAGYMIAANDALESPFGFGSLKGQISLVLILAGTASIVAGISFLFHLAKEESCNAPAWK